MIFSADDLMRWTQPLQASERTWTLHNSPEMVAVCPGCGERSESLAAGVTSHPQEVRYPNAVLAIWDRDEWVCVFGNCGHVRTSKNLKPEECVFEIHVKNVPKPSPRKRIKKLSDLVVEKIGSSDFGDFAVSASAYKVWRVDCEHCGNVVDYEDTHPEKCEFCGAEVEESDVAD